MSGMRFVGPDNDGQTVYRVGGMFDPGRDRWPEGPHLWMNSDGVQLAVFLTEPHPLEVADLESGKARFAWVSDGPNGFLLFKLGGLPWSDVPFNPQRLAEPFDLEPLPRGVHQPVYVFGVHADSGIIFAMQMVSWPAYFLNHVVDAVRALEAADFYGEPEARRAQADFYRRYPDGPALGRLVRELPSEGRCLGGQREDRPHH